jgi:hypothetical protein
VWAAPYWRVEVFEVSVRAELVEALAQRFRVSPSTGSGRTVPKLRENGVGPRVNGGG